MLQYFCLAHVISQSRTLLIRHFFCRIFIVYFLAEAEGQTDVDKVLMHLEAKEFTVEPSTLQSLQQLIQWVADLAINLLVKVPDSRPTIGKSYELIKDVKALNMLREMLVLIRIWGLLRPACLPVFIRSDASMDVLALLFR